MKIARYIISGGTILFLIGFTIWAGFDWVNSFGKLDFTYWCWALTIPPLLILFNAIWLFI